MEYPDCAAICGRLPGNLCRNRNGTCRLVRLPNFAKGNVVRKPRINARWTTGDTQEKEAESSSSVLVRLDCFLWAQNNIFLCFSSCHYREQQSPVAGLAMVNIQHVKGWNRRKGSLHRYCVLSNSGNQYCLTVLQTAEDSPSVAVSRLRHEQVCMMILSWSSQASFILTGDTQCL